MTESVLLCDIKDNPYRDKKRNPIDKTRVQQLVESITTTDFWKGVYGRKKGDYVEIAFGHHRVDAAREAGLKEIPIEIMDLSDSDMLMRMTRENLRGELLVSLEAVSAAVKAFGTGTVQLERIDPSTRKDVIRYAPSFIPGKQIPDPSGGSRPYTADTLARFLGGIYLRPPLKTRESSGRAQDLIHAALGILEMEERKVDGFSERVLRIPNKGEDGTQYLGAKAIIKVVSDVKEREVKIAERKEKTKEEIAALDREARAIEAERKAREKAIEEKEEQLLKEMKEARKAEDEKKAQEIQDRIKAANEAAKKKDEDDVVKLLDLEVKINERKEKEVEQRKEDLYVPIRKEVDRIVHLLERRDEEEELKALSRKGINPGDRERVRQAAMKKGSWFTDVIQDMFLPPISVNKKLSEYRSREESKRRAEETTKPAKKGKK